MKRLCQEKTRWQNKHSCLDLKDEYTVVSRIWVEFLGESVKPMSEKLTEKATALNLQRAYSVKVICMCFDIALHLFALS